jgi:5-methylcytosine-specific restriction endonuclease McrBC GTP-binding regulatory subunit McrB
VWPLKDGLRAASRDLFLSVRPDWRDSKALLGYYNPLTEAYEWTPFLRFLERASRSYRDGDGLAWFVILDEMNLAHVEYYFADLLSVMESGRDDDGWTREALTFVYPETAEGDVPPREMTLPPNLYVVGTVNIDETTHAFSPKVLDRAFSIELVDVDFSAYPPEPAGDGPFLSDAERQALLAAFTRDGRFPRIDKAEIAAHVADHPEVRDRLQTLNVLLQRDNLHFGYRVFDEIVTFLAVADENGMFDDLGDNAAFDAAVLMKVLPKFHGSRGKLDRPLRSVLAWCLAPDDPQPILPVAPATADADPLAPLQSLSYVLPRTANRVLRMLAELQTDGFTAFG